MASDHEERQDVEGDTDWCQDHLGDCGVDKVLLFHDDTQLPAWRWQQDLSLGAFITAGDRAGTAVAIDADTIAYGVPGEANNEGAVFVFIRDDRGTADPRDDSWVQQAKLKASDGLLDDEFGTSLDIDGDVLSVGAPGALGFTAGTIASLSSPIAIRAAAGSGLLDIDDYYNGQTIRMTSGFAGVVDDQIGTIIDGTNFTGANSGGVLSAVDGFYNGQSITIGTETRTITGYNGTSKQFTVDLAFTNSPSSMDRLQIGAVRMIVDYDGGTRAITLDAEFPILHTDTIDTVIDGTHFTPANPGALSSVDGFYNGLLLTLNNNQSRLITGYDGVTKEIEVASAFGGGLAVGNLIEIGSVRATDTFDVSVQSAGAVYVFERTGSTWSETQRLNQTSQRIDDRLGGAVAMDNGNLLAGVSNLAGVALGTVLDPNADTDRFNGDASLPVIDDAFTGMVLQFTDGPQVGSGRLITGYVGATRSFLFATPFDGAPDNGDAFRVVPAESGTTVVFHNSGGGFTQETVLTPIGGTALDLFGSSVDVEGDRAVIGAPNAIGGPGSAYIFNRDAGGNWTQSDRLQPNDLLVNSLFGGTVALDNSTVAVSAIGDPAGGVDTGSVYVFDSPAGSFVQRAKLLASDASPNMLFGTGLDVRNGRVVVGAPGGDTGVLGSGSVYVFNRDDMGNADPTDDVWTEFTEITGTSPNPGDDYGAAIALDGDNFVAGDPLHFRNGAGSGTAEVFVFGGQSTGTFVNSLVPIGTGGLHEPRDIAFSGNEMYVSSLVSDSIIRYDVNTGDFIDLFIRPGEGGLDGPHGLDFGPDGKLYVSSTNSNEVIRYNADGSFDQVVIRDVVNRPSGLLIDGTDIYVSSSENDAVLKFRLNPNTGAVTLTSQLIAPGTQGLDEPVGLAIRQGLLYVASAGSNEVMRFNSFTGAFVDIFADDSGVNAPALSAPMGLEFDNDGNIYVTNEGSDSIYRYDGLTGEFIDEFVGPADEGMVGPVGISLHDGILHVAVADNDEVMRFNSGGTATFDYFQFEVTAAESKVILDLDGGETGGPGSFNSLMLVEATNDFNDDASPFLGEGGSLFRADSYLELELDEGIYVVAIGEFDENDPTATVLVNPADHNDTYTLHISIEPGFHGSRH